MHDFSLIELIFHFDQAIGPALSAYGNSIYLVLFTVVVLEIGVLPLFFLPGNPMLFIVGALCAAGSLQLALVVPLLLLATVLGSVLSYGAGYALGDRAYHQHYRWLNQDALRRAHAFYESRGAYTFLLTPFIAVIRTFAPFAAGVAQMTFRKYLISVTAGAAVWTISLPVAGYYLGNVPLVRQHMATMVLAGIVLGVGSLVVVSVWKVWRRR
ncbi:hypothetical protein HPT27_02845 [Permianibacter sp. IMCC34836]|uniref:VTT domain-containing protein n=1 Tax=Permianibacter fluminis TaxID=2738515 RepID=UPI001555380B|nr:VTT domain-containing protein [Permianibacter fluminis]NQD35944.1 hypothetical protein [Permianibacter fluminis]